MRVLHVIPSITEVNGGPSAAVTLMAESLAARGIDITIVTTDDAGRGVRMGNDEMQRRRSHFAKMGIELIFAPKRTEFYKTSPGLVAWLWRNINSFHVTHIHALFSFSSVIAGQIASIRRIPFILRPLGVLSNYGMTSRRPALKRLSFAMLEGPLLTKAAAVHFTSESERDEAMALGRALRAVVLPLGVPPPARANPEPLLREISAPPNRSRLLYLSRIDPKKNLEGVLQAMALLRRTNAEVPFLMIAGDGHPEYVAGLRQLATSLGISDSTAWLGRIEGRRKEAAWAAADLFILASHSENFGIAAAEAMLAGLPSLLGEGVALAEDAAAAGAAYQTSTNPADIAAHLAELLANPSIMTVMGERARAYGKVRFSTDTMAERLVALYENVLSSRGSRADAIPMAHICE